jgi:hypothetical protein
MHVYLFIFVELILLNVASLDSKKFLKVFHQLCVIILYLDDVRFIFNEMQPTFVDSLKETCIAIILGDESS